MHPAFHALGLGLSLALFSSQALAHPGAHPGNILQALAHLLSEPDHLALLALAVAGGVLGARLFRRRSGAASKPLRHH